MEIQTDSERVRTRAGWCSSSSARRSTCRSPGRPAGRVDRDYMERYGADPRASAGGAAAAGERDERDPGHHHAPTGAVADTVAQPVKVDNELYVRDYSKCILCYKCVEACGEDAQNTFAIAVAGRGFDARISTESGRAAARLGLRVLRQLHRRLPDRRARCSRAEYDMREAGHLGPVAADRDRHDLPVLRRRAARSTLHVAGRRAS